MSKMKWLLILLIFLASHCTTLSQSRTPEIEGVIIESLFPNFELDSLNNKWVITKYDPIFTRLYFYKDQVLLQTSRQYGQTISVSTNEGNDVSLGEPLYHPGYYSIAYSDSKQKALFCDSSNLQTATLIDKDSALLQEPALNGMHTSVLNNSYSTLLTLSKNKEGDSEEVYSLKGKNDTSMTGTLTLIFSKKKMQGSRYSLDKEIEAERKMKLVKMITVTDERYVEAYKVGLGAATILTEVRALKIENPDELLRFFDYAQQQIK